MDSRVILPQPQRLAWKPAPLLPLPRKVLVPGDAGPVGHGAAQRLAAALETATATPVTITTTAADDGQPAFRLRLGAEGLPAEGYRIDDDGASIDLSAADPLGISHAVETARQLLGPAGWPSCHVEDWPDFRHRGIYVESFWGTDLMDKADWQTFVDYLVSLKFNTLNVGLHGCWEIKYNGEPTEFLMVPLRRHLELRTPQTVRYLDPHTQDWVEARYLPRAFEDDYLPEVFAYARARGMQIVPQFGGPGHNTLIPRLFPELSAKQADGTPTGYGYCISSPQTWAFLDDVIEDLVERYCRPFGVSHFNIAGDEVYPIRNILPEDPHAEVSPWCACPQCRGLDEFEQLAAYLLGWTERLVRQGIRAVVWADSLARMDKMAEFKRRLADRGLQDQVVVQWWCYKEPLPELTSAPEVETWVEPSPGLVGNLLYQDFSRNIYGFLQRGRRAGATGVTAYNVPDLRLDKNYACLAEFSWNTQAGSIPHFHIRYAQRAYGPDWRTALEAYDVAERIMGCYPMAVYVMDQLLHYFHNFPHGRIRYPLDLLRTLVGDPLAILTGIRIVASHMESAEALLAEVNSNLELRDRFRLECCRYRALALAVLAVVDGLRLVSEAESHAAQGNPAGAAGQMAQAMELVQQAHDRLRATMEEMARRLAPYLLPTALRELSALLAFLGDMQREIESHRSGETGAHPLPLFAAFDLDHLRTIWHPWEF